MPLDPSIALSVRPVQAPGLLDSVGRAMTLRQIGREGEAQELAISDKKRQAAEQERQAGEQQRFRQAYAEAGADPEQFAARARELGVGPDLMQNYTDGLLKQRKELSLLDDARLKGAAARNDQARGLLMSVESLPPEQRPQAWQAAKQRAVQSGLLSDPSMLPDDYDPTMAQALVNSFATGTQLTKEEMDRRGAAARDQTAQTGRDRLNAELPGIQADVQTKQIGAAERTMPADQAGWDAWRAGLPASLQARVPAMFSPAAAEQVGRMAMSRGERDAAQQRTNQFAETQRHNAATEGNTIRGQNMAAGRRVATQQGGGADEGVQSLVEAVLKNPALFDNLTPTARTKIAPLLSKAGFEGFGTQLSNSAITRLADSRTAIGSLHDLRKVLQENEQYLGPVAGFQAAVFPWSDARKAQADIDRVKQRVGKALEGGVLRKEDEEKYKRILATVMDKPSTALYKVDKLVKDLERDIKIFEDEQRKAGRKIGTGGAAPTSQQLPEGGPRTAPAGGGTPPAVGGTFNGEKVLSIKRVQ